MFQAKIITDSLNAHTNVRLTTMELTYPHIIHAEVMTHRDRARNAASSRAIPWHVTLKNVTMHPFIPIKWGMEQKGMQTGDEVPAPLQSLAKGKWLKALNLLSELADDIHNIGDSYADEYQNDEYKGICIHKSLVNRLLEPWNWITVIMTATKWNNFFRLRCHPDAEVHFQMIANMARDVLHDSTPRSLQKDNWHLPYITDEEKTNYSIDVLAQVSAARCARVSYLTHDGQADITKDLLLFSRLSQGSGFGHWSPMEHIGKVASAAHEYGLQGCFHGGWVQYRHLFPNQCAAETTPFDHITSTT